jgi:hypothetical protein
MVSVSYKFFKTGFKGSTSLNYVKFSIVENNFLNTWSKNQVMFVVGISKYTFKGFI